MKKIKIQGKLSLNKSTIASLNAEQLNQIKGGGYNNGGGASKGCTDGCTSLGATLWNCSKAGCSNDCISFCATTTC